MAARVEPGRVQTAHQSLHHLVARADWSDAAMLAAIRAEVLPAIQQHGPIQAWIIGDTGFPKKGVHSVGVGRQYCGQLGKQENCQVAVSLSVANQHASLPVVYRLYLPKVWAEQGPRRQPAQGRLAPGDMAPGHECVARLPLCRHPRPPRPPGRQRRHAKARGVVPDRMADRGGRAHQVLALHPACHDQPHQPGPPRHAALAHRARLPGDEARDRPRPLRGPRLARLPSPPHPLHRSLRLPRRRTGDDSPLSRTPHAIPPSTWRSRRLPTTRRRRSGLNATSKTPSPPCACASPVNSPAPWHDVPAASASPNIVTL